LTSLAVTGNTTSGNLLTGGLISSTGTITGSSHLGSVVSVTGAVTSASVVGGVITGSSLSVTGTVTGTSFVGTVATASQTAITSVGTLTSLSVSGNITGGNLSVGTGTITLNNIVNGGTSATGNVGSTALPFNTVFAKATSAQYADLAEQYLADALYEPGTVVSFGGALEVTASTADSDARVAGVVSTNPAYLMNSTLTGDNVVAIALTGRVPCRVTGTVRKGDLMVSNGDGTARAEANPAVGTVIGKALADFDGVTGVIEIVVGRV